MIEYLYEWVRGIAYYMVLVTVIMQIIAGGSYRKYIRLFTGIILVLMILTPVMQIFGMNGKEIWAQEDEYEKIAENIEKKMKEMDQEMGTGSGNGFAAGVMTDDGTSELTGAEQEKEAGRIEVGEIRIGR